jgi:hypothetical protein
MDVGGLRAWAGAAGGARPNEAIAIAIARLLQRSLAGTAKAAYVAWFGDSSLLGRHGEAWRV